MAASRDPFATVGVENVGDRLEDSPENMEAGFSEFGELLRARVDQQSSLKRLTKIDGVVLGVLVGLSNDGATPLVTYRDQPGTAALPARATVDLSESHIGRAALLAFEEGDPHRPIVVGCLRESEDESLPQSLNRVELDSDGERLVVSAKNQIVLRCGKASITLTKAGKVIIKGSYVSQRSSGLLRIKGASVGIN